MMDDVSWQSGNRAGVFDVVLMYQRRLPQLNVRVIEKPTPLELASVDLRSEPVRIQFAAVIAGRPRRPAITRGGYRGGLLVMITIPPRLARW